MKTDAPSEAGEALRRIAATEPALHAWAYVAPAPAGAPAEGPLAGLPCGVKDVIDVAGMPTGFGLRREYRPAPLDAWCVALLRSAGAVPVGKTRTTAHAYLDPAPTVNPLDPVRTPGGSSAGSAAAVAAGHVPFALGTQTIGSVLRPAAYCGVVGFKPSYGRIPTAGVAPLAPSLDHVGIIARDVALAQRVAAALLPASPASPAGALRLAAAETLFAAPADVQTVAAVRTALERLRANGISLSETTLPAAVTGSKADAEIILGYEAHAVLAPLLEHSLPAQLRGLLQRGATIPRDAYRDALARREAARAAVEDSLGRYDAIVVPCGNAAPPRSTTGDATPFAPWSFFGAPAISIPIPGTRPAALSLQLVAHPGSDARLLAAAAAVEAALA